jgi:hypothetical protein
VKHDEEKQMNTVFEVVGNLCRAYGTKLDRGIVEPTFGVLWMVLFLCSFIILLEQAAWAQSAERRTPLGVQSRGGKQSREPLTPQRQPTLPAVGDMLKRIEDQHRSRESLVGEGSVTVLSGKDTETFGFTVVRDGESQAQHIVLKQPDGKAWDGLANHLGPAGVRALEFIQTQHARGLPYLLNYKKRDAVVVDVADAADGGTKQSARVLMLQESSGEATRYFVDGATSRLIRMEFSRGQTRDARTGRTNSNTEAFVFSDFRNASSAAEPFKVEHYSNGTKLEELQFTSMMYPTAAKAAARR